MNNNPHATFCALMISDLTVRYGRIFPHTLPKGVGQKDLVKLS